MCLVINEISTESPPKDHQGFFYRVELEQKLSKPFQNMPSVIPRLQESLRHIQFCLQLSFPMEDQTLEDCSVRAIKTSHHYVQIALISAVVKCESQASKVCSN